MNHEERLENRDKVLAYEKQWREKNREEIRAKHKIWRDGADREKFREGQRRRQKQWYYSNVDAARAAAKIRSQEYRKRYPDRYLESIRKSARKRKAANKAFLDEYKRCHPCVDCGESDYRVLDFHHCQPSEKKFTISLRKNNKNMKRMLEEIAKCVVLCSNCHRRRHYTGERNERSELGSFEKQ